MEFKAVEIHRGRFFTLTQDPYRSVDFPSCADSMQVHEDGVVIVNLETGVIVASGSWKELFENPHAPWDLDQCRSGGARYVDHHPFWIFPGFVDAHTHLPQLAVCGRSGVVLQDWLKRYIFPAEAKFSHPAHAEKVSKAFFERLVASGTTTAAVMTTIHAQATQIAFEHAEASGLRILMGKMLMDMNAPSGILEDYKTAIKTANHLCDQWHGKSKGLISYLYSPRFAITCSKKLLEACGKEARARKVGIHTHLNETRGEVASAMQLHGWAHDYTDIYLQTGLLHESHLSILAHQIYPTAEELMSIRGLPVCCVHCPSSNSALQSGEFDYLHLTAHGIDRIALGTDIGAGPQLSLFDVMRCAQAIAKNDLSVLQLYYLATLGGAKALGVSTGALLPGFEADFIVLNPEAVNPFPEVPLVTLEEVLLLMLTRGHEATPLVVKSYVRGQNIFTRGQR